MTLEEQIRSYIAENYLLGDEGGLGVTEPLFESGILDSTGALDLIEFLQERFAIEVENKDLVPDNLASIRHIAAFVRRKLDSRAGGGAKTA